MSDQGEKTCPLCAEEMDLTDQQLKPCKCGYDICVWCWHHIMDMAERDGTEGRCPACRTPYNKEKIVGTTAKCERLVAEMSMEKKTKSKSKSKTSDGRKQLSSVRVIQRNLVYIVGLPLNLADEDLLQGKEYFAQYGKVLKVSISRTAVGTIQLSANNTCSVYITYSKEEEAVRCIQSVHGYSLEGRPLRACFGTTKYCHAWLRNAPCTNPDCLYLHEIGSHEDSFTKDEIVSAYTRSRMQQIASGSFDTQQRSGDVLPPPADDYCNNSYSSSGNPINKTADNTDIQSDNILSASVWQTPASSVRGSPPNSRSTRVGLPAAAAWGMSASNSHPPHASVASLNGSSMAETSTVSPAISTAVAHPTHPTQASTLHSDVGKKPNDASLIISPKAKLQLLKSDKIDRGTASDTPAMSTQLCTKPLKDKNETSNMSDSIVNSFDNFDQSRGVGPKREVKVGVECVIQKVCSDLPSHHTDEPRLQQSITQKHRDIPSSGGLKGVTCSVSGEHIELRSDVQMQVAERANCEVEDNLQSFNVQRIKDTEVDSRPSYVPSLSQSFNLSDISRVLPPQSYDSNHIVVDPLIVHNKKLDKGSIQEAYSMPLRSDEYPGNQATRFTKLDSNDNSSYMLPSRGRHTDDVGESSIISNILSMNFDSWDESLASPHDLVKMLGEGDKQQRPIGVSNSWKLQTSGQSRFSFAREDVAVPKFEQSFSNFDQAFKNHHISENGFTSNRDFYLEKSNGSPAFNYEDPDNFASIHSLNSYNFSVSRATGSSAPPGFSGPKRTPPPGFTTHERMTDPIFDIHSGNNSFETSSPSIKPYQAPPPMNMGTATDIEFMDPAILAVGKGRLPSGLHSPGLDMRSVVPPQQVHSYANEAQLQLLMQRSLNPQKNQNQRYVEMGGNFSTYPDHYGIPSRMMEQTVADNISPLTQYSRTRSRNQLISNGNWNSWNEVQRGNELSMAELLRTEQLGIDKLFNGYEDSKYRIPNSTDMYNYSRTYGI